MKTKMIARLRRAGGEVHVVDDKASVDKLVRQIHGGGR